MMTMFWSKLFMRKDYFESFNDILTLNTMFSQKVMVKPNKLKVKKIMKTKFLKIRLITWKQEIINLKKINEGLKSDTKSHLKILETLSEGNPTDLPWQTT